MQRWTRSRWRVAGGAPSGVGQRTRHPLDASCGHGFLGSCWNALRLFPNPDLELMEISTISELVEIYL